jgi:hypothetical protein
MSSQHIFVMEEALGDSAIKKSVVLPPSQAALQHDVLAEAMLETTST